MKKTSIGKNDSPKTELEKRLEAELARSDEAADDAAVEVTPEEIDVAALMSERDELKDQVLRARAEFDNYRKRVARDAERVRKTAAEGLVRDLLPVVDHLELALAHADGGADALATGVRMVLDQFREALTRNGVEPIPAVGEVFDPNVHEAMDKRPSPEVPEDHVSEEFQKGYRLGGQVLRPSKVVVSAGMPVDERADADPGQGDDTDELGND